MMKDSTRFFLQNGRLYAALAGVSSTVYLRAPIGHLAGIRMESKAAHTSLLGIDRAESVMLLEASPRFASIPLVAEWPTPPRQRSSSRSRSRSPVPTLNASEATSSRSSEGVAANLGASNSIEGHHPAVGSFRQFLGGGAPNREIKARLNLQNPGLAEGVRKWNLGNYYTIAGLSVEGSRVARGIVINALSEGAELNQAISGQYPDMGTDSMEAIKVSVFRIIEIRSGSKK